ncbi:amidohydrolase [Qiania dongpingensis]|uniref:Amidohydrolase n=1 Tax=Qiania dongpingensis TaxID=2763669 RepID=A0A7G9G1S2_9FIRM|nr:amidohydrolase [Qiania dongpingensis]QNM04754.1 amidohydrolase [Qiania dongpingensis]
MELDELKKLAGQYRDKMIAHRVHLHMHPELPFCEKNTSAYVKKELERIGVPYVLCEGNYGIVATVTGGKPGKNIGFRADMDALEIQEANDVPYCSQVPGVMHACGHDGHTAVLLGLAEALTEHKELVHGTVRLFFQPAEELAPGGAKSMVDQGFADGLDEVYALHFQGETETGTIRTTTGAIMANADSITVTIHGRGAHAADPNLAADALLAGAAAVCALQNIVSRFLNPLDSAVVSICTFHSGEKVYNVLQDKAVFLGTVRTFSAEARASIEEKIHTVLKGVCEIYGTTYELEYEKGYPAVINDRQVSEQAVKAMEKAGFHVEICRPDLGGEDFAYFLNHTPGCFAYIGCGNRDRGICASVHTPKFDIDEDALESALLCELALYGNAVGTF